jgi:farnesyl-diphosphate farnesyltransferase
MCPVVPDGVPDGDLDDLLRRTSRTFALAIPLLPDGLQREVGVSYLLLRIADTLEDAERWPVERRVDALAEFAAWLENPGNSASPVDHWLADPPSDDQGYLDLLRQTPAVLQALDSIEPERRELIAQHAASTARGMSGYVSRGLAIRSVGELRAYCWVVAGSVGELLTGLFASWQPTVAKARHELASLASSFGEGLQLVNILKDSLTDARAGRRFLPEGVERSTVAELARLDLAAADRYVQALKRAGAASGIVAFCTLPLRLAEATLDRLSSDGAGAKVTRQEVSRILEQVLAETAG